ncbi:MAG: NADH-ubiquinone oxidoreductase-F iron-sulfur binding region domain-containing protein [Pirellulales bacterium]
MRFVSISGDVVKPGVYEVPFGQSVRELVMECAGGMRPGRTLKAIATSGPSSGFLPDKIEPKKISPRYADELVKRGVMKSADDVLDILDMPLDLETFKLGRGLMLGAAFVAYDDRADMLDQALNSVEFYRNESCGKCVPCRVGSEKMAYMLRQTFDRGVALDDDLVKELGLVMIDASICGLGQVVPNSILTVLKYFPDDIRRHIIVPGATDAG